MLKRITYTSKITGCFLSKNWANLIIIENINKNKKKRVFFKYRKHNTLRAINLFRNIILGLIMLKYFFIELFQLQNIYLILLIIFLLGTLFNKFLNSLSIILTALCKMFITRKIKKQSSSIKIIMRCENFNWHWNLDCKINYHCSLF